MGIVQPSSAYTVSGTTITFEIEPPAGSTVRIGRKSSQEQRITNYEDASLLTADTMDLDANQLFYMAQEAIDTASETNLAGSTFYNTSVGAPENPKLGDLWYDEHNKYLKVFNGTSWDLASPSNETAIFESDAFDNSETGYTFIYVNGINIEASVYLNGIKLVRGSDKASLLLTTDAKDYYIDTDNNRIYFKTLDPSDIVQIILSLFAMGTAQRASEISVIATQGQTVFNLAIPYVPNSTSLHVYVNGVRQSAYTETDKDTVTFDNGLAAGDEVSFIINKYLNHTLLSAINQADVDNSIALIQATVDSEVVARASDISALTSVVQNHASSFNYDLGWTNATLSTEQSTRATADSALASDITTLTATVNTNETTNAAAITAEQTARATADSALASDITTLTATVNTNETTNAAAITAEQTARATADSALASDITTLQGTSNNLQLKYGVTLDGNGHVTGFSQNNDGTTGEFKIVADKFSIVDPNNSSSENSIFEVVSSGTDAGVYIEDTLIKPEAISTVKIAGSAISDVGFAEVHATPTNSTDPSVTLSMNSASSLGNQQKFVFHCNSLVYQDYGNPNTYRFKVTTYIDGVAYGSTLFSLYSYRCDSWTVSVNASGDNQVITCKLEAFKNNSNYEYVPGGIFQITGHSGKTMKTIITYDNTGLILSKHVSNISLDVYLDHVTLTEGQLCIEIEGTTNSSYSTSYVDTLSTPPIVKEKTALNLVPSKTTILAGGAEETVISNIPEGVFVTWPDGQRDEVTDGVVEFSTTQPDTYVLKFDGVKYLTEEVSIEAHV